MNKENMQKWVDALRSGQYKQVKGALTVVRASGDRSHCCLGVAVESGDLR